jgi:hypothetical protein
LRAGGDSGLFAAGFDSGSAFQILGQVCGIECLDIHLDKGNEGASEVGKLAVAAVYDGPGGCDDSAMVADDLNGFLDAATAGDDILGDNETLAGLDLKTPAEDESAGAVFFNEDVFFAQVAGNLLADDDSADSRRNNGRGLEGAELVGEQPADMRRHGGVLQKKRALEKLAAVQAAAQDEMPVEESAGFAEEVEDFVH